METPLIVYDSKSVGNRLKRLRKNNKITQEKLAEMLNVSKHTIYKYEKGQTAPSYECIIWLCQEFNVSADYFLFGYDKPLNQDGNVENEKDENLDELLKRMIAQCDNFKKKQIWDIINVMFRERPAI